MTDPETTAKEFLFGDKQKILKNQIKASDRPPEDKR